MVSSRPERVWTRAQNAFGFTSRNGAAAESRRRQTTNGNGVGEWGGGHDDDEEERGVEEFGRTNHRELALGYVVAGSTAEAAAILWGFFSP